MTTSSFGLPFLNHLQVVTIGYFNIQRDSKRWTQLRTFIFPELYIVCE